MAYRDKTNGPVPADDATQQTIDTLGVLFNDGDYGIEVSARWSDERRAIVIVVQARRNTTPDEQARLIEIMAQASPNDLARIVYERWKVTLDRPLDFIAETEIAARSIPIDLKPLY